MAGIRQEPFGKTADGHEIMRYWLSDGVISVGILNLGGTIQSVLVPDRSGADRPADAGHGRAGAD